MKNIQITITPKAGLIIAFALIFIFSISSTKKNASEVDVIKENLYQIHQKVLTVNAHPDFYKSTILQIENINRTLYDLETNLQTINK